MLGRKYSRGALLCRQAALSVSILTNGLHTAYFEEEGAVGDCFGAANNNGKGTRGGGTRVGTWLAKAGHFQKKQSRSTAAYQTENTSSQ